VLVAHNISTSTVTTGPLAITAAGFDVVYADAGVPPPTGTSGAWSVTLPPHSSAVWRVR
jgi:hypothetical protein